MSSSSYKKIDNNNNSSTISTMDDDLEKSSFFRQTNQHHSPYSGGSNSSKNTNIKPVKKTNYGSLRTETQQTQTAKVFLVNYRHKLTDGETLQGISLKYGVSVCVHS